MIDKHYDDLVRIIVSDLWDVMDDISNADYGDYPLIAYVNDSLLCLCELLNSII